MGSPFTMVPWTTDFMRVLAVNLARAHGPRLDHLLVVFPHQRPGRYLLQELSRLDDLPGPFMPPRLASVDQLFHDLALKLHLVPARRLGMLDQTGLLMEVADLRRSKGPLAALPSEPDQLFPWCARLAGLMEELLRLDVDPRGLDHLEGEVHPVAAAILADISGIFGDYVGMLDERRAVTPGLEARRVARQAGPAAELLSENRIVLAGFYALGQAEETLFRTLWDRGAEVWWHTDPDLQHWCVREHRRWRRRWSAAIQAPQHAKPPPDSMPVRFFEGFDLHSQLERMTEVLHEDKSDTAVVAPDPGMLLPVLHHLPEGRDINVSVGYPLRRTPLAGLLETILRLQENSPAPGEYSWKDLLELIRHPYLKMLRIQGRTPLRAVFRSLEPAIRNMGRHVTVQDLLPDRSALEEMLEPEDDPEAALALMEQVFASCLDAFETTDSLAGLARACENLGMLLLEHGRDTWHTFLIDAECLYRLLRHVVPELGSCALSRRPFSSHVLHTVLRQYLQDQRVPFEADPLTGLQVLGMLETRLLSFSRLVLLEATESHFPGHAPADPLLPDSLRSMLGLTDSRERDHVSAYNFHRLVKCCQEVIIFYSAGIQPGLLDDKNIRSRYVEQLLWEEERRRRELIRPGQAPLELLGHRVSTTPESDPAVAKTPAVIQALENLLNGSVTPTLLDDYLRCPLQFFHRHLAGLETPQEALEEADARDIGELVHATLEEFHAPHLGKDLDPATLDPGELTGLFAGKLATATDTVMPQDQRLALEHMGRLRLAQYLKSQGPTRILGLEQTFHASVRAGSRDVLIKGKVDRVDMRENGIVLLDYKTGSGLIPARNIWTHDDFWRRIMDAHSLEDTDLLAVVSAGLKSLQLPVYFWLHARTTGEVPDNAALVSLRDGGKENVLFGRNAAEDDKRIAATRRIPALLDYLVGHMLKPGRLEPMHGKHCQWCEHGRACTGKP